MHYLAWYVDLTSVQIVDSVFDSKIHANSRAKDPFCRGGRPQKDWYRRRGRPWEGRGEEGRCERGGRERCWAGGTGGVWRLPWTCHSVWLRVTRSSPPTIPSTLNPSFRPCRPSSPTASLFLSHTRRYKHTHMHRRARANTLAQVHTHSSIHTPDRCVYLRQHAH